MFDSIFINQCLIHSIQDEKQQNYVLVTMRNYEVQSNIAFMLVRRYQCCQRENSYKISKCVYIEF